MDTASRKAVWFDVAAWQHKVPGLFAVAVTARHALILQRPSKNPPALGGVFATCHLGRLTAMIGERQVDQAALFYEFSLAMRRIDLDYLIGRSTSALLT